MPRNITLFLRNLLFVFISAALLVLSFPCFDLGIFAWFALVPFLLVIMRSRPMSAFLLSVIFGVAFYTGIFFWMFKLSKYTILHHILLGVYLGPLSGARNGTFINI